MQVSPVVAIDRRVRCKLSEGGPVSCKRYRDRKLCVLCSPGHCRSHMTLAEPILVLSWPSQLFYSSTTAITSCAVLNCASEDGHLHDPYRLLCDERAAQDRACPYSTQS
ncbi:hypothetical protein PsYK624_021140 [Phanerochaete sordida]|uniref:Uncharacterized protein n=1 Tax=Phanerochaete sordida TaxID=48140 RepID=A0A9P3L910_9APHY|nr:hypothetical protein PsYK624_021140 [Phanerochaete sordida]